MKDYVKYNSDGKILSYGSCLDSDLSLQELRDARELLETAKDDIETAERQNKVDMAIQAVITAATASDQATEAGKLAMKEKKF